MNFTPKESAFKVESLLISAEVVGDYEVTVKGLGSAFFTELITAVNHQLGAQVGLLSRVLKLAIRFNKVIRKPPV